MQDNKINNAGYRLLQVLKVLIQKPLSVDELLSIAEETSENSYRKELVNKYINTLRLLNIPVIKEKSKYYILRGIDNIDFNESELSMIEMIKNSLSQIQSMDLKHNLEEALQIIERNFSQKTDNIINLKQIEAAASKTNGRALCDESIKKFEKYCKEKLKLSLKYKNTLLNQIECYSIAPVKIVYKNQKAFLVGYHYETNSYKEFLLSNIVEAHQLPQISTVNISGSVTFKLKNRLAASYKLKEGETIIERGDNFIIVSNSLEDKDLILKRLIRYYGNCEILYPRTMKEKMLKLIEEMEHIYD